ncbi:MAG: hypothetical protein M1840_005124 [Geoglossum simile]|nr:MAG: hypothetical protein M1840_005124 [Geoglossum simile]
MEVGISTSNLNTIHARLDNQPVTPSLHAFCQLTPVPSHATEQILAMDKIQLLRLDNQCHNALSMWLSRRTRAGAVDELERPSLAVPSISRVTPRSRVNTTEAFERDGSASVVTRVPTPTQVAHIFPYSLASRKEDFTSRKLDFYKVFSLFYGPTDADQLQTFIFGDPTNPRTSINRLENLITLRIEEHNYFGDGKFVLEPEWATVTPTAYTVVFHKLPGCSHNDRQANIPINEVPVPYTEEEDERLGDMYFTNRWTREEIVSGMGLTLTTNDPETRPLPDPKLLALHAALSRVVRMAGRAGVQELGSCDDGEDEEWVQTQTAETGAQGIPMVDTTNQHPPAIATNTQVSLPLNPPTTPPHSRSHPKHKPVLDLLSRLKGAVFPKAKVHTSSGRARPGKQGGRGL